MIRPGAAPHLASLALLTLSWGGSACLVTDKIQYGERNVPANLSSVSPPSISVVPPVPDPVCQAENMDGGTTGDQASLDPGNLFWMDFQIRVSDSNVEDVLRGRMFINGKKFSEYSLNQIPVTGTAERDLVQKCIRLQDLDGRSCNHVEFVVTRQFDDTVDNDYATEDPNDFAKVEWWVRGPAVDFPDVQFEECLTDGGVP